MVSLCDELNRHLTEGVRKLDAGEEIDLDYVNKLSGLYQACHYNAEGESKLNLNKIINGLWGN